MVSDITVNLLAAFNAMISGIGTGIVALFESLIIETDCGVDTICGGANAADDVISLGSFGIWMFALMGITLAIGVFTRLLSKVA